MHRVVGSGPITGVAAAALFGCVVLAGCSTPRQAPVAQQFAVTPDDLVGKWGLASYRVETDRPRTEVAARAACSNPYVIGKGPSGGVIMHLADQAQPQELVIKTGGDGAIYVGPPGNPGDVRDRRFVSYDPGVFVVQFVDPDAAKRYGTMLYVRCGAARS